MAAFHSVLYPGRLITLMTLTTLFAVFSFGVMMYELFARELLLIRYLAGSRAGQELGVKDPQAYARKVRGAGLRTEVQYCVWIADVSGLSPLLLLISLLPPPPCRPPLAFPSHLPSPPRYAMATGHPTIRVSLRTSGISYRWAQSMEGCRGTGH